MKVQILPSSIDDAATASQRQHLMCVIVNDAVAIDAGCLAFSCTDRQRQNVRDIVLTHTHLDHVAGLPMFIDDLFASLTEPIRVFASAEMIDILESHLFNWALYPRFSELTNLNGPVFQYRAIERREKFAIKGLEFEAFAVNHKVSANGFIVSDNDRSFAITGDTAETSEIWQSAKDDDRLRAVFVECAFPDSMADIAKASDHLTPQKLAGEIKKLDRSDVTVYVMNLKPMYRETIVRELHELDIPNLVVAEVGKVYDL